MLAICSERHWAMLIITCEKFRTVTKDDFANNDKSRHNSDHPFTGGSGNVGRVVSLPRRGQGRCAIESSGHRLSKAFRVLLKIPLHSRADIANAALWLAISESLDRGNTIRQQTGMPWIVFHHNFAQNRIWCQRRGIGSRRNSCGV